MRCHREGGREGAIAGNARSTGVEHLIRGQRLGHLWALPRVFLKTTHSRSLENRLSYQRRFASPQSACPDLTEALSRHELPLLSSCIVWKTTCLSSTKAAQRTCSGAWWRVISHLLHLIQLAICRTPQAGEAPAPPVDPTLN